MVQCRGLLIGNANLNLTRVESFWALKQLDSLILDMFVVTHSTILSAHAGRIVGINALQFWHDLETPAYGDHLRLSTGDYWDDRVVDQKIRQTSTFVRPLGRDPNNTG